jgi:hypothetical protein
MLAIDMQPTPLRSTLAASVRAQELPGKREITAIVLWTCIALFFLRVVGQIEVLLVAPEWLPPMSAWYSGLLPYPILLPLQIALLMLMSAVAIRKSTLAPSASITRARSASILRALALLYFAVMAARLVWCVHQHGSELYLHGAIPIAFHWVLALFLLSCTISPATSARPLLN